MAGVEVSYGNVIQVFYKILINRLKLLHLKSNKYVTVSTKSPAQEERNAMKVYLDKDGKEVY